MNITPKFIDQISAELCEKMTHKEMAIIQAQLSLLFVEVWGNYLTKYRQEAIDFAFARSYFGPIFSIALDFKNAIEIVTNKEEITNKEIFICGNE